MSYANIVLSGLPAAGKTTLALALESLGVERLDVGALLQQRLGADVPRPAVGPAFVERFGKAGIARAVLKEASACEGAIAFDAIRLPETCTQIRASSESLVLVVYVEAPEAIRRERLVQRYALLGGGSASSKAFELQSLYDSEVVKVRPIADMVVENADDVEKLVCDARRIVGTIHSPLPE